jgi:hypothetical protein
MITYFSEKNGNGMLPLWSAAPHIVQDSLCRSVTSEMAVASARYLSLFPSVNITPDEVARSSLVLDDHNK